MDKKDVKRAFNLAEQEIEKKKMEEYEKQVSEVKEIVKRTLQEIESLKDKKQDIDERLRILKLDIEDLKEGKLERIKERQDKDPKAKEVSIIIIKEKETIIKEKEVPAPSPWYQPYYIQWNTTSYPLKNTVYCDSNYTYTDNLAFTANNINSVQCNCVSTLPAGSNEVTFTLNNSIVKDNAIGAYKLESKTVHLR